MSIRSLETILWLARLESLTATAQRPNTTQPAVSGRIRALGEPGSRSLTWVPLDAGGTRRGFVLALLDLFQRS